MDICLMIEGQESVTWDDWKALAEICEATGISTLFRSDHYLSLEDRTERSSLDAWGTICGLGAITSELRLGTLVSPVTFRHPALLAKTVVTADHISDCRVELGIGAGWWEREHEVYGFDLAPDKRGRFDRLEEQLQVIRGHWGDRSFDFEGDYYHAKELEARPKPIRAPILVGGVGKPRSLRLAARYADEYNTVACSAPEIAELRRRLDRTCEAEGRDPKTLPLSLAVPWLVGADQAELVDRAGRLAKWRGEAVDAETFLASGWDPSAIQGTVSEAIGQVRLLEAAGLDRLMAVHLLHRDLDAIALLGNEVIPAYGSIKPIEHNR
jgi:alkanesulfonate monooxygenase SsuD/methylene tetrahydromethanopterin reductase-like flavin-dependent oxidoreductase (luciferase family)